MTTLFILGLMFCGALFSLVLIPLVLLKAVLGLVLGLVVIPLKILAAFIGGLTRGVAKGVFLLVLFLIPLAVVALPLALLAFGVWLVYRLLRPRRPRQAYVVA